MIGITDGSMGLPRGPLAIGPRGSLSGLTGSACLLRSLPKEGILVRLKTCWTLGFLPLRKLCILQLAKGILTSLRSSLISWTTSTLVLVGQGTHYVPQHAVGGLQGASKLSKFCFKKEP